MGPKLARIAHPTIFRELLELSHVPRLCCSCGHAYDNCPLAGARKPSKWAPQYQGYIGKNAWELSLRKYKEPAPTGLPTPRRLSATSTSSPRAVGNLPGSPRNGSELIKATKAIKA